MTDLIERIRFVRCCDDSLEAADEIERLEDIEKRSWGVRESLHEMLEESERLTARVAGLESDAVARNKHAEYLIASNKKLEAELDRTKEMLALVRQTRHDALLECNRLQKEIDGAKQ